MQKFILPFLLFCILQNLLGQNSTEFFKDMPLIQTSTPNWAVLMYSDDPNVFEVDFLYSQYYEDNRFIKTIHTQNYKFWRKQVAPFCTPEGLIRIPTQREQEEKLEVIANNKSNNHSLNNWQSIGPFKTYRNGTLELFSNHANVYSIDQSLTNSNVLLIGTESGGVFHSLDKGQNWSLITKDEAFAGSITAVQIDPTNHSRYLIYANNAIYESTNAGASWTVLYNVGARVDEIKFNPHNTQHICLAAQNGYHQSYNNGNTWSQLYTEATWDVDFHPTDNAIIYLLKSNPSEPHSDFLKSTNSGSAFSVISNGWYSPEVPSEASESGGKIAVSPDDPDRVYACLIGNSKLDDDGWIGLYRSDNAGDTWYLPSGQIGSPYNSPNTMPWNAAAYTSGYHQGFFNFDCEAAPADADLVWFGTVRLNESSDGGATYTSIGAANSNRLSHIHADIQAIEINGTEIWVASDGGINYSTDLLQSHEARHNGIIASNFWGFNIGWNEDIFVGGKYHNGNTVQNGSYGLGNSHNVGGVEEATGYVNPLDNRLAYFNQYWSGYTVSKQITDNLGSEILNGTPVNIIPNESYVQSSSSGLYFHPKYADKMYAGKDNSIYNSNDGGNSWQVLYSFPDGKVFEIDIARSNPDIIYCVHQPGGGYWDWCELHKSIDGGQTFTKLTDINVNLWRIEFCIDPYDPNIVWAAPVNAGNGEKVWRSTNGGSTWQNMTSSILDNHKSADIMFQPGSGGAVYLATDYGYFYFDPSNNSWVDYSAGLPFETKALQTRPYFAGNTLRLGTSGRGVWEAPLPISYNPSLEIMTSTDIVQCSRDTILLDSYSYLDNTGVTWNWTISPTPLFIDNANIRNPKVVLGTAGTYDIQLQATLPNSTVLTANEIGLVTVQNGCDADTIPGSMLQTVASGDYVQLPHFDINTETFTMTAWVKPNGIQNDYTGIVMSDGDAAGLNFRGGNNTLGYHWPGGQWWWNSNLIVPSDEWSHVALVANATEVVLYLNGQSATHAIDINAVDLTSLKIASYKGWASRNFIGDIEEVCLWNRALTQNEIRGLRHLTKENIVGSDPDFVAYYQFNDVGTQVLDRVGTAHGAITGNAALVDSSTPVGGGDSSVQNMSSSGNYSWANGAIQLSLNNDGTFPNDEVWGTVIHQKPFDSPDSDEPVESYFILNNYGNTVYTATSVLTLDDPLSSPLNSSVIAPNQVQLIERTENGHLTWSPNCSSSSIMGENYTFGNSCEFQTMGQYFLFKECETDSEQLVDYINSEVIGISVLNQIDAVNTIGPGSNILYDAGNLIQLDPGFCVEAGAVFEAIISGCDQ